MSQPSNTFNLVVPITGFTIRKDATGVEKFVLTGLASNTSIDQTGERMAKSAISAMIKSLQIDQVTLNNEHGRAWDDDFGEVTRFWSTDGSDLMMEAELDPDHYRTQTLIKALKKGKKLGLSIGGKVIKASMEYAEEIGRKVLTYTDIELFHVAITGTPAVADTWVTPITKSMKDWKEMPMSDLTTKSEEQVVEEAAEEVTEETQEAVEDTAPAEDVAKSEETSDETTEVAETEAEEVEEATTDEGTTPTSDSEGETEKSTDETTGPDSDSTPAEQTEAPSQEEDAQESAEAASETAEEDGTSEVEAEKSAVNEATVIELTKSIAEISSQVETLTKSLSDATAELETVQSELEEKAGELETATEELVEATKKIEEFEAIEKSRKAKAFEGFEVEKSGPDGAKGESVESHWLKKMSNLDHQS